MSEKDIGWNCPGLMVGECLDGTCQGAPMGCCLDWLEFTCFPCWDPCAPDDRVESKRKRFIRKPTIV